MRKNLRLWIATAFIVCVNLFLWTIPSNLAYNVAQQREILLGRYTLDKFITISIIAVVSLLFLVGIWSKKKQKTDREKMQGRFKAIALTFSIVLSVIVTDAALRFVKTGTYTGNARFFHRVPNKVSKGITRDVSHVAFSYPILKPGYPEFEYTLTVDKNGFRNKTDLTAYDIVTIGDSFTEGSCVSDDQPWPVVLSRMTGLTVYNLGLSGASPAVYVETMRRFVTKLHPKTVFCMLYEGNDFRASNFDPVKIKAENGTGWSTRKIFETSPLRAAIVKGCFNYLAPIGCDRFAGKDVSSPGHPLYAVSWQPITVPDGPAGKNYDFDLKALLDHYHATSKENLSKSTGWQCTFGKLREMKQLCGENGIRLIIVYAPDKPHILPPLFIDKLPAQQLLAFMALREKNLPPAKELVDTMLSRLDVKESAMKEFCQKESIEFVSLTDALREGIAKGTQVYFTYDQHWTPPGHEIVAQVLSDYLKNSQINVGRGLPSQ